MVLDVASVEKVSELLVHRSASPTHRYSVRGKLIVLGRCPTFLEERVRVLDIHRSHVLLVLGSRLHSEATLLSGEQHNEEG